MLANYVYRQPPQYRPQLYRPRPIEPYTLRWLYDRATQQYSVFSSIDADTVYAGISSPAVAAADIRVTSLTVTPSGVALTLVDDGNDIFSSDGSRQSYTARIYDTSVSAFMAVTGGGFDFTVWFGNQPPEVIDPQTTPTYFLPLNVAMTSSDLRQYFQDGDGDTLTATTQEVLPTGLSIVASSLIGTPTVKGISTITVDVADITGASTPIDVLIVTGTITVPDVDNPGTTLEAAIAAIQAVYLVASYSEDWSDTVPDGEVISQSPSAGTEVDPNSTVTLVISRGVQPDGGMGLAIFNDFSFNF